MITRKVRHKNEDGTVVEADIGALAKNVEEDEQHRFVSDEEKKKWNRGTQLITVILPAVNWTGTEAPFVQTVDAEGITETDKPGQGIIYPENCTRDQQKAINKAAGYLYDLETGDGTITFRATLKPTVDITLGLKGVN